MIPQYEQAVKDYINGNSVDFRLFVNEASTADILKTIDCMAIDYDFGYEFTMSVFHAYIP